MVMGYQSDYGSEIPAGERGTFGSRTRATIKNATAGRSACAPLLVKYIRTDAENDPAEVAKLKSFLAEYEGVSGLPAGGSYDAATRAAVIAFQEKYRADVLTPWGQPAGNGYVYKTTRKKVNEIYCSGKR